MLKVRDGTHPGQMTKRHDFPRAARGALQRQQGRVNPHIPKNETLRQRPFDEKLRSDLEWQSWNWKVNWSQALSSSSTDWHEPQQEEWQYQQWWEEWQIQSLCTVFLQATLLHRVLLINCPTSFVAVFFPCFPSGHVWCPTVCFSSARPLVLSFVTASLAQGERVYFSITAHLVKRTERVAQTHNFLVYT